MLLENEDIQLRAVEPEDLDRLYRWENNPQLWEVGNTRNPYSRFVLRQYIVDSDKNIYENKQLRLMMVSVKTGDTVGTVDLFDFDIHNSRIALGLYVDTAFQGKGYAKTSLGLVEEYVFDYLNVNQLYCHIAETNTASMSMFEQEQYEKAGLLKDWIKTVKGFQNIVTFQQFKEKYISRKKR